MRRSLACVTREPDRRRPYAYVRSLHCISYRSQVASHSLASHLRELLCEWIELTSLSATPFRTNESRVLRGLESKLDLPEGRLSGLYIRLLVALGAEKEALKVKFRSRFANPGHRLEPAGDCPARVPPWDPDVTLTLLSDLLTTVHRC